MQPVETKKTGNLLTRSLDWYFGGPPPPEEWYERHIAMGLEAELTGRVPKKYNTIASIMWILSYEDVQFSGPFRQPEGLYPALSPSYYWFRLIDDRADGDLEVPKVDGSFYSHTKHFRNLITSGEWENVERGWEEDFLLKRVLVRLKPTERLKGDSAERELVEFLEAMNDEYDRRVNRKVLTKKQLQKLNWNSFRNAQNVALMAMYSRNRVVDMPELPDLLGRAFALADLKPELKKGICNIPKEVLKASGYSLDDLSQRPVLTDISQPIIDWKKSEYQELPELMLKLKQRGSNLDLKARAMLTVMIKSAQKALEKSQLSLYQPKLVIIGA